MTEEITEAIRNAFNEYLNAVDKIILENQALQIELRRLEQENKILKSNTNVLNDYILKNEQLKTNIDSLVKVNENLKQENKELKEKKDSYYQQTLDDEILMNELSLEVDLRKKESDFYLEKLSKYRSALEEIRDYLNTLSSVDSDFINTETYLRIQDKINECLGG